MLVSPAAQHMEWLMQHSTWSGGAERGLAYTRQHETVPW